eukprot:11169660-Lingulodinium_polyedra.AAC.1
MAANKHLTGMSANSLLACTLSDVIYPSYDKILHTAVAVWAVAGLLPDGVNPGGRLRARRARALLFSRALA